MKVGDVIPAFGGHWTVRRILGGPGCSGMGIIYVLYDADGRQPMAIKTIQDELYVDDPGAVERFTREAYLWINLGEHPNVTRAEFVVSNSTLTGQSHSSRPCIVLEYVSGGDLGSWIGTPRLQNPGEILRLASQFCDGMAHALSQGIGAHRDIKPANCLMTEDGTLKVTDFGLAKALAGLAGGASRLAEGDRGVGGAGTPPYMAPEQFYDFANVDVRADIYSFGIMLYEMVTGEWPFTGRTWDEFKRAHASTAPPRLRRHKEIDDIVQTCLRKDPTQRFSDFSVLRQSLGGIYERAAGRPAPRPVVGQTLDVFDWSNRGNSLLNLEMYEDALLCFERALGPPTEPVVDFRCFALSGKGTALWKLDRLAEALATFDLALQAKPESLVLLQCTWTNRAAVLLLLGRANEAMTSCDAALAIEQRFPRGWRTRGDAFFLLSRFQDALICYSRAIELSPDNSECWQQLGLTYRELRRHDDARNAFRRSVELDPQTYGRAWDKAIMLMRKSQADKALECCGNALAMQLDDAGEYAWKGLVEYILNGPAGALPFLENAVAGGHQGAGELLEECRSGLSAQLKERLPGNSAALEEPDMTAAYQKLSRPAVINDGEGKPLASGERRSFAGIKLTRLTAFLLSYIGSAIVAVVSLAGVEASHARGYQAGDVVSFAYFLASVSALLFIRIYFGLWYARNKGRASLCGLFAALGLAGWLILWILADYRKTAPAPAEQLA